MQFFNASIISNCRLKRTYLLWSASTERRLQGPSETTSAREINLYDNDLVHYQHDNQISQTVNTLGATSKISHSDWMRLVTIGSFWKKIINRYR